MAAVTDRVPTSDLGDGRTRDRRRELKIRGKGHLRHRPLRPVSWFPGSRAKPRTRTNSDLAFDARPKSPVVRRPHFGLTDGLPPGVPGGGITGMLSPDL